MQGHNMKKILGGLALSVVLATPVLAADLRMPVKAAPAPVAVVFDWTGCYIGGHVGYAWGRKRVYDGVTGAELDEFHHDVDGWLIGGQVGCNLWQRDRWVFGIEGQAAWADIDGSVGPTGATFGPNTFRTEADIIGSIAARLGYAFGATGQTLFFVKGGAAFIHEQFSQTGLVGFTAQSDEDLRWGWMVGAGFEHAFNRNWSFKAEYNFNHFGKETHDLCTPAGVCDPYEIRQRVHLVKFGINYRFGGPLVARY
jgi:outer membrane immunogenic protein